MTGAAGTWGLDDDVLAYIARAESFYGADSAHVEIDEQRRRYVDLCRAFDAGTPRGVDIRDDSVAGRHTTVPVRIYRPAGDGARPCLVYIHGGGWVLGSLESHHGECADIADKAGVTVIAVDYRLAPEHPYPAAHDDAWDALVAIAGNAAAFGIDPARVAVGGDSAGANIAAGLAIRARDEGGPALAAQILIYGALGGYPTFESYAALADAPMLSTADMEAYMKAYCGSPYAPDDPLLAPIRAASHAGLPPSFLQPAAVDPLLDDSLTYAALLRDAGVAAELSIEEGLPHGFLRARHGTARGSAAFERLCAAIKARLVG